ncbi:MAG: PGF-pre-PGF domain-containing protein [Nanoarchaeota archaeon]
MKRAVAVLLLMILLIAAGYFIIQEKKFIGFTVSSLNGSDSALSIGEQLKVDLRISDVTDLEGIQVDISYNSNVLTYTDIEEGTFLSESDLASTYFNESEITASGGVINDIIIYREGEAAGVNGSGLLFSVYFNSTGSGSSSITASQILLSDSNGTSISTSTSGLSITVSSTGTSTTTSTSGGGGSSAGTVAATPSLVETQTAEVSEDDNKTFIFQNFSSETGIKKIEIEATEETTNPMITVSKYDARPINVSTEKTGEVYRYLQIEPQNFDSTIEKTTITFQVEKSWLSESNLEKGDISLFKFDANTAAWGELPTRQQEEDDVFYYYDAETGSFSYFAIAQNKEILSSTAASNRLLWIIITASLVIIIIIVSMVIYRRKKYGS